MRPTPRLVCSLLLGGCVSYGATNTPITEHNATEEPALVGRWVNVSTTFSDSGRPVVDSTCLVVGRPTGREYRAVLDDCDMRSPARIRVGLAVLGGELFAVTQPILADTSVSLGDDVLALYSFYRLRFRRDSLLVAMLDADALRSLLAESPALLPHVVLEGNGPDLLLTAPPAQLAWFLSAYARDSSLWEGDGAELGWARLP